MKICSQCKKIQQLEEYTQDKGQKSGLRPNCKSCDKIKRKTRYKNNKEKLQKINRENYYKRGGNVYQRNYRYEKLYGITTEQYDLMLKQQDYKCAICNGFNTRKDKTFMPVDHCHKTGKVRAILCDRCNKGMGVFNDCIDIMQRVIDYLKKYQ